MCLSRPAQMAFESKGDTTALTLLPLLPVSLTHSIILFFQSGACSLGLSLVSLPFCYRCFLSFELHRRLSVCLSRLPFDIGWLTDWRTYWSYPICSLRTLLYLWPSNHLHPSSHHPFHFTFPSTLKSRTAATTHLVVFLVTPAQLSRRCLWLHWFVIFSSFTRGQIFKKLSAGSHRPGIPSHLFRSLPLLCRST